MTTTGTQAQDVAGLIAKLRRIGSGKFPVNAYDGAVQMLTFFEAAAALEAVSAELARAREALRPFSEFAQKIADERPGWDHDKFKFIEIGGVDMPTMAAFRRARAALKDADNE